MEQVTMYRSSDNQLFPTEPACVEHEESLATKAAAEVAAVTEKQRVTDVFDSTPKFELNLPFCDTSWTWFYIKNEEEAQAIADYYNNVENYDYDFDMPDDNLPGWYGVEFTECEGINGLCSLSSYQKAVANFDEALTKCIATALGTNNAPGVATATFLTAADTDFIIYALGKYEDAMSDGLTGLWTASVETESARITEACDKLYMMTKKI